MSKKKWSRHYTEHCTVASSIIATEELISTLMNKHNYGRKEAVAKIREAGVEILSDDPEYAHPKLTDKVEKMKAYDLAMQKAAMKRQFREIYTEIGPSGFSEVTEETGVEFDDMLREYKLPVPALTPSAKMKNWITGHLKDGQPHRLSEVVESAVEAGVLPDPNENLEEHDRLYNIFKNVGSTMGVAGAGGKGRWMLHLDK